MIPGGSSACAGVGDPPWGDPWVCCRIPGSVLRGGAMEPLAPSTPGAAPPRARAPGCSVTLGCPLSPGLSEDRRSSPRQSRRRLACAVRCPRASSSAFLPEEDANPPAQHPSPQGLGRNRPGLVPRASAGSMLFVSELRSGAWGYDERTALKALARSAAAPRSSACRGWVTPDTHLTSCYRLRSHSRSKLRCLPQVIAAGRMRPAGGEGSRCGSAG